MLRFQVAHHVKFLKSPIMLRLKVAKYITWYLKNQWKAQAPYKKRWKAHISSQKSTESERSIAKVYGKHSLHCTE